MAGSAIPDRRLLAKAPSVRRAKDPMPEPQPPIVKFLD
jgi:hypothetical protein